MARKITIEILTGSWFMEDRGLLLEDKDEDNEEFVYASWALNKNRIVYLFDHLVVKIDDKIKEDKRFLEVCEFIYLVDDKEQKRFTGTFIDALEFIKKEGSFYG
ncbi:MAG: hypothetical protein WC144_01510 [Sulfurimonas sp.]|jgi:hypothetical protein|nr:hypothetical protein [Sulfurimonadaceae bacterium]